MLPYRAKKNTKDVINLRIFLVCPNGPHLVKCVLNIREPLLVRVRKRDMLMEVGQRAAM